MLSYCYVIVFSCLLLNDHLFLAGFQSGLRLAVGIQMGRRGAWRDEGAMGRYRAGRASQGPFENC